MVEPPSRDTEFCFTFVVHGGPLEAMGVLLAASLRNSLGPGADIVAGIPQPEEHWRPLGHQTTAALEELGVRTAPIENPVSLHMPHANKLGCLAVDTDRPCTVFLDTDVLVLRPFEPEVAFPGALHLVPASRVHHSEATWAKVYGLLDLDVPPPVMVTSVTGRATHPYYNSGMVATRHARELAASWGECARELRGAPRLGDERFNSHDSDQVSLPPAIRKLGLQVSELDPQWNFPTSRRMWRRRHELPVVFHYQEPEWLLHNAEVVAFLRALLQTTPQLRSWLGQDPRFSAVLVALDDPAFRSRRGGPAALVRRVTDALSSVVGGRR